MSQLPLTSAIIEDLLKSDTDTKSLLNKLYTTLNLASVGAHNFLPVVGLLTAPEKFTIGVNFPTLFATLLRIVKAEGSTDSMKEQALVALHFFSFPTENSIKIAQIPDVFTTFLFIEASGCESMKKCARSLLLFLASCPENYIIMNTVPGLFTRFLDFLTTAIPINSTDSLMILQRLSCLFSAAENQTKIKIEIPTIFTTLLTIIKMAPTNQSRLKAASLELLCNLAKFPENLPLMKDQIISGDFTDTLHSISIQPYSGYSMSINPENARDILLAVGLTSLPEATKTTMPMNTSGANGGAGAMAVFTAISPTAAPFSVAHLTAPAVPTKEQAPKRRESRCSIM